MEMIGKLAIAIISLLLGVVITRVLDRGKPLLVIEKLSTATKNNEDSNCSEEVSDLTKKSWAMGTLQAGEIKWGKLSRAYDNAKADIKSLEKAEEIAGRAIELINSSSNKREYSDALKEIFSNPGMQELLEMIFLREKSPEHKNDYDEEPVLSGFESQDGNGCFVIVFDDSIGKLGNKIHLDPWRKEKLEPLFNAIIWRDKDYLVQSLKKIDKYAKEQRDINKEIKELLDPLREDETIWIAHCSLSNYGKTPLVLKPTSQLVIVRPDGKKEAPIECYVSIEIEKEEGGLDASDIVGAKIISPNSEERIWVITKDKKSNMENGNIIEAYFKDEKSKCQLVLDFEHPDFSLIKSVTSNIVPFTESES